MAGGGAVVNVADLVVMNGAAAVSTSRAGFGQQFSFGVQHTGGKLSLNGSVVIASHDYRDLAADYGDPAPRLQVNASAGWTFGRLGAVGLAFVGIKRDAPVLRDAVFGPTGSEVVEATAPLNTVIFLQPAQQAYVASASYSVQIGQLSVFATGFRDFVKGGGSGALLGVALPLGRRSSVSIDVSVSQGSQTVQGQATQSAVAIGDWGYQVVASPGNPQRAFGEVRYKSRFALLSAGIDYNAHEATLRGEAEGSVSMIDHSVFVSNTIYDSFAVVDTNGLGGVHVRSENRDVGVTDSKGRLLVPELRSYDLNNLSIEPSDIPLDAVLDTATRQVRPQNRSGIVIRFPVQLSRAALLRLVDIDGTPVPIGSTARLAHGEPVPVGYDGEAYLPGLSGQNNVQVERSDGGRCVVHFEFVPVSGAVPVLGPLRCVEQTP